MKQIIVITVIFCGLTPFAVYGQADSTATDTLSVSTPDTLGAAKRDTLESTSARVKFKVRPWQYHPPLHADTAATDSTLRWQVWPSWTYKKNRDPGVITYRLGTIGRTNALQIGAQEPKYQQLFWEGIRLNDPVSGTVNWNYIPQHKLKTIFENNVGPVHRTSFYLRDYYLNKPLTKLNYTESSHDTRSLQFVASANFSQKNNVEISYWDRRDGGGFANSSIIGRQIFARITHQIDHRQEVKIKFLNNNYDNSLPFGYVVADPRNFNFDVNEAQPNEPNGEANRNSTIIGVNYYRRPADSAQTKSTLNTGLYVNSQKRKVTYSADTTDYKVRQLGLYGRKWQQFGSLKLEETASLSYFLHNRQTGATLATGSWLLAGGQGRASYQPLSQVQINGQGQFQARSDGFTDYRLGAGTRLTFGQRLTFSAGAATGSLMPTPQQLYWQSRQFHGNQQLEEEKIQDVHASLGFKPSPGSKIGLNSELKLINNGIRVGEDSTFTNGPDYSVLGATAFARSNSTHFEFSGSATLQQFGHFLQTPGAPLPLDQTQHIWFRGSAYVKGYLFSHATYVKAGLAGVLSPQGYSSARYYPSLDFWQSSDDQFIPSFNRLDVELSARVRSVIVLLRYENVLDNLSQQGYFETAGYPMMNRRFIFGIRVLFRN